MKMNRVLFYGYFYEYMKFITAIPVFCLALFFASCLNPIGFTPDLNHNLDGSTELVPGDSNQSDKPGDTSPADDPDLHPDPDKGSIIFKNLTGGQKAMAATFTITGQEHAGINIAIPLNPGQEKSIALLPGTYNIVIAFDGAGSPISGSKALLAGRVEYVYFYVGKDGSYKGGINVDSSIVYGDINLDFYQDNENAGENNDSDSVTRPEEGDVSRDDYPRHKLPSYMRENYGIVWVHNMSKSKDLMKAVFDHFTDTPADDPAAADAHWEMNPGPNTGGIKSIILRPGDWNARGLWILGPGDAADPDLAGGVVKPFTVIKAGAGNYINHLYFYKGTDGKWHFTTEDDPSRWNPPYEPGDINPAGAAEGGGGETKDGEGQFTNEGGTVDTGNAWWDANRNNYGILQVKNLSSRVAVTKVEFESGGKRFAMDRVSPRNDRSIVLATGIWNPVTVYYTVSSVGYQKQTSVTIHAVGLTGRLNYLYFYYKGSGDYDVALGDTPPDYQNDSTGGASGPGYSEGDSPGALNDTNRDKLGLLILRNLSPDVAVDKASFQGLNLLGAPATFSMDPGPALKDQKSILLAPGQWTAWANYTITATSTSTPQKNVIIVAGQVSYMYFYKTRTGGYALSPSWPPLPDDSASDNADPGTIIGDDEGWLNVINNSASGAIIDRVQYNNGGTWIDIAIPTAAGTVAPGSESDPDLVVLKGSWSFRFKTLLKQTYSRSVSRTIRPGQTVDITYTDALDADEPPDGYGTLRIVNDSSSSVYRVKYTNLSTNGAETLVDINIAQGQNQALVLKAPPSSPPPSYTYSVKCYISSGGSARYVQNQVNIVNQGVSTITITNDTPTVVESGNDNQGHIRIYNNYDNYEARRATGTLRPTLPLKFFKVGLKYIGAAPGVSDIVDGGIIADSDSDVSGQLNLRAGFFTQLDVPTEGQYELWILWGNTIAGDTSSLTLTKYGTYDIAKNTYRDIYIDFYNLNTAESTAVNMRITHVGYPSAAGITQIQIWYGGDNPVYNEPGKGGIPARVNGATNDTYIVYKNNDILYAGDYREFKLVPGKKYWARVHWPLWNNWVGTGGFNADFTLVHLATNATTGHLQFVYDDANDMLKFFSDQATGVKLNTIGAAKSLLYRPGIADPLNENNPHNFYGLKSVRRNEYSNYIEGIDITPYIGTRPVVYAENKYLNATIRWFKRQGTIGNNAVGWGPPVELNHTGAWADNDVVYDKFTAPDWYYAEVILGPKQGYDISNIPVNFFEYDDYALANNGTDDPIVLAPASSNSNTGGDSGKGRIYHGTPGANSGMSSHVGVSGNQIKVRLWFRVTQDYPNPLGGPVPPNAPSGYPEIQIPVP
jgi:hypothetical protein